MSNKQREILFMMGQVACLAIAIWSGYQKQWAEALKFLGLFAALRFDPNKHKETAIALLCCFTLVACRGHNDWQFGIVEKSKIQANTPVEGLTFTTYNSTPIPGGTPGVWAENSGGNIMFQNTAGDTLKMGEATSIKLNTCSRIAGTFGMLCADSALSEYYIYINGWKKLPQEDILLLHRAGAETITGRKTFPGGMNAPIIPSILSGTGVQVTGHIVPNIADDTFALLLAAQEFRNKTIDATLNTITGVPLTTTLMIAGAGMTGGGDLSVDRTFNVIANADGSITVNANDIQVGILATDAQHGNRGGGALHADAIAAGAAGFMTGADKTKLDGIAPSATATPLSNTAPLAVGTADAGIATSASRDDHVHAHGNQLGGALHANAVSSGAAGFMTGADKARLDAMATNASNIIGFVSAGANTGIGGGVTKWLVAGFGDGIAAAAAETITFKAPTAMTVSDLTCRISAACGVGEQIAFTIQKSTAASNGAAWSDEFSCTISGAADIDCAPTGTAAFAIRDLMAFKSVSSAACNVFNAVCSVQLSK